MMMMMAVFVTPAADGELGAKNLAHDERNNQ